MIHCFEVWENTKPTQTLFFYCKRNPQVFYTRDNNCAIRLAMYAKTYIILYNTVQIMHKVRTGQSPLSIQRLFKMDNRQFESNIKMQSHKHNGKLKLP